MTDKRNHKQSRFTKRLGGGGGGGGEGDGSEDLQNTYRIFSLVFHCGTEDKYLLYNHVILAHKEILVCQNDNSLF